MTYTNPYRYCNRTSIDGAPLKKGFVLVPVWLQEGYQLPRENHKYLTTYHIGEFRFRIGFMQYPVEGFESYMTEFRKEIRTYINEHCSGRCVIDHDASGYPVCCPKSNRCTGCNKKYELEHFNPLKDSFDIWSLDFCYEDEDFDYADENAVDPEEYVCSQEDPSEDELYDMVVAYFSKKNPRYVTIYELSKKQVPIEEICSAIGLKNSRGREVINDAHDALCEFLKLRYNKKRK